MLSENTNGIKSVMLKFQGIAGEVEAYVSKPDLKGPHPSLIVIHEIFGLNDHIKDVTDRFARHGYVAFAPDLFSGDEHLRSILTPQNVKASLKFMQTIPVDKMRDLSYVQQEVMKQQNKESLQKTIQMLFGGLPKERFTQDLSKAVEYLNSQDFVQKEKVGSVGFCFGGGMSLSLACHAPLAACVVFYGENPSPIELVQNIQCPVLGIYGGEDVRINSNLYRLVKAMTEYKKDFEMKIYSGAAHAFFNDTSKATYRETSAKDAWDRTLRFLKKSLT